MASLITTMFKDWIRGCDSRTSLISVFEHIRDIPYSLAVPMDDPTTSPEQILDVGKGSCRPKHYLLADMYRRLGFEVLYATIPFLWSAADIRYPPGLRQMSTGLTAGYHLACRVKIDNRWILVDATWDLPLKREGFPVNEHWDGRSDTRCAVKPLRPEEMAVSPSSPVNEPFHERLRSRIQISL